MKNIRDESNIDEREYTSIIPAFNLEEMIELGIDVATLCNALSKNSIDSKEFGHFYVGRWIIYTNSPLFKENTRCFSLREYGKTWILTRDDLERFRKV